MRTILYHRRPLATPAEVEQMDLRELEAWVLSGKAMPAAVWLRVKRERVIERMTHHELLGRPSPADFKPVGRR
jgi:hypothetical protein